MGTFSGITCMNNELTLFLIIPFGFYSADEGVYEIYEN